MPYRVLVKDKSAAVAWYRQALGFEIQEEWGPAFAILSKGADVLWLSGPQTSAAQPMPNGDVPVPGGWNRIVVEVENLDAAIEALKTAGTVFRNTPVTGPGGTQVLVEDPSGNPVEVFQAR